MVRRSTIHARKNAVSKDHKVTKKKSKPPLIASNQATSQRDLARKIGRGLSPVRRWLSRDDWPFGQDPPWDVEAVKAWAEKTLYDKAEPDPDDDEAVFKQARQAKLKIQIERGRHLRIQNEVALGKLHSTAECRRLQLRKIHAVKSALLAMPRSLAPELVGKETPEIERILTDRCLTILNDFASGREVVAADAGADSEDDDDGIDD